jgi:ribosomal protein S18 acetylase RimI-like enzyme
LLENRAPGRYWVAEDDGRVVGQLLITYEWSDWRNRMVWWIQSVHVAEAARKRGVFRALYEHTRQEARAAGAGGLRLYVDTTNTRAQAVYRAMGMNGEHYRVFEDMFV